MLADEIELELASLTECLEPAQPNSYQDQLNRAKDATADVSWLNILGKCFKYLSQ